jgi:hypothetical protein
MADEQPDAPGGRTSVVTVRLRDSVAVILAIVISSLRG